MEEPRSLRFPNIAKESNAKSTHSEIQHHASAQDPAVQEFVFPDNPTRSTTVLVLGANGLSYPIFVNLYDSGARQYYVDRMAAGNQSRDT